MPGRVSLMLRVGANMTPIAVREDIPYQELLAVVGKYVGSSEDAYKQSLIGFSVLWEQTNSTSLFPERTLVNQENLQPTLELIALRQGKDVLVADRKFEHISLSGAFG
ncbi:hypothetical protein ASPFODRAFT_465171 [Aspergillus luchuensis CBS 106.47]|uniref:Uncharacterized protein n=1 Tax=Aspergillus luchuensis (strain CBS 106.47) TaxID=1137211 RepID=A0A1M3T0A3_ASPLC|nr:hypothetical protein ASPFODRAFT_465171 [Aspergillus luchuensis CBS 106.47]